MGKARKPVVWLAAAVILWLSGSATDRTTELQIRSIGGRVEIDVAGTTLSAPIAIENLTAVTIRAMDSIDPPGGGRISIISDLGTIIDERLPSRFRFPQAGTVPAGDWNLDDSAAWGTVWERPAVVSGDFTIKATFRGRFQYDLDVELHGSPGASIAIRRGLINHDAFIRSSDGTTLAATSIDPTPLADFGAIAATILRAAAVASILIALFATLQSMSHASPRPAASRRWQPAPWVGLLAVAAFAVSAWVAGEVLEGLPHQPDSVTYLLQARWLLAGDLWGSVSQYQRYLDIPYTYVVGQRWLGHYPQGWPLLLALGLAVGTPWLVAPLLGALFVALLFLAGRELDGAVTGLLAAILGLLSPMVRLIFGCMLSHAAAATLILAGFWLTLVARRLRAWPVAGFSGIAFGLAFGVRPLSATAAAVPISLMVIANLLSQRDRESREQAISWHLGGVIAALPTLAVNQVITGSALRFPYSLANGPMYLATNLPFGIRNLDVLLYSAGNLLHGWGWPLFHGPFWVALAFAVVLVPFLLRRHTRVDLLLAAMVVSVAAAHLGTRGHGLHGFGPRYLFETFPFLLLLSARGFVELARYHTDEAGVERRLETATSAMLFVILCGSAAAVLPSRLGLYSGYNGVDSSLERQVAAAGLDRAVVLLPPGNWRGWAMAADIMDRENDVSLLFIQAEADDPAVADIADGRPVYVWRDRRLAPVEPIVRTFER